MFDIKKASTLCDRLEKFERIKGEDNEKINYNGIEKIHFIKTRIYCFFLRHIHLRISNLNRKCDNTFAIYAKYW